MEGGAPRRLTTVRQIPPECSGSQEFAPPFAVPFGSLLFPRIGPNLTARRPCHYALYVKDLAKRPKWASFERFQFCVVDSTERRAS